MLNGTPPNDTPAQLGSLLRFLQQCSIGLVSPKIWHCAITADRLLRHRRHCRPFPLLAPRSYREIPQLKCRTHRRRCLICAKSKVARFLYAYSTDCGCPGKRREEDSYDRRSDCIWLQSQWQGSLIAQVCGKCHACEWYLLPQGFRR